MTTAKHVKGASIIALTALLSACGPSTGGGGADDELSIGLMHIFSGPLAGNGEAAQQGFELYLQEHGGELGGRPVNLIVEDTEGAPDVALRKLDRLIEREEVEAIVGIGSSPEALAVRDVVDEAQVPLVITQAQTNALSHEARSDYVFRTSGTLNQYGYAAGLSLAEGGRKVRAQTWDIVSGQEVVAALQNGLATGDGELVGESYTPFGATPDFQPYVTEISGSGATDVYSFYAGGDSIAFLDAWNAFGLADSDIKLSGFPSLADETVLPAAQANALGVRTISSYTWTLDNPANDEFVTAFEAEYGSKPSYFSAYAWDAAALLDKAIASLDGDTSDPAAFASALEGVGELESPRGTFVMNPETHNPDQSFYVLEVVASGNEFVNEVVEDLGRIDEQDAAPQ